MSNRYDSSVITSKESADELDRLWCTREKEYNTVMKVSGGYVVTNKFDPQCNDKITPVTPGFVNHSVSGS